MTLRPALVRLSPIAAAIALGLTLSACSGTGLVSQRTQGYVLPDDAITQVRPGSSQDFVRIVLGSPQTTSTFGGETAWYYVETKVTQTAFGLTSIQERTVLAVYFGADGRVTDRALYSLEDGRAFAIEQRRTGSFGEDRNFVESLLASI
ncbi:outer membrane protein assembly factor BamE [Pelagibacterium nitratireducens]|jgi:outer membrane protein assembly factor BamE (lipoprotein component of BamABCDE complex)|uniref:Outer membrane protein assembly factor BamE n=1 Tax=Pelagibacterium nitratireducens TaxID=1046114 RepID=A0ABZ2I011_9HYPH|nr:cell envelope protein SmpA [Pelagibacterium sp.]HCO55014.1 outer membrane protein assembly factor BamE [Pelagibacterium sp.]|tara:strand:- start:8954 stop:9400 length:447 start_codon:yes stop_codon:yes gene_type:complete